MRIAFLILNHRPPTQLLRLIKVLRSELPDSPIIVHHDEFAADLSRSLLDFDDNAFLLTTGAPISWGDFGVVDAYWQCLSWICENVEFDWVVLLSGQDYPIKPLRMLAADLAATGADIVRRALSEPAYLIAANAGYPAGEIVAATSRMGPDEGFDALAGRHGNMIEMGVVDPLRVVRAALQNGASVAGLLLTTNTLVAEEQTPWGGIAALMTEFGSLDGGLHQPSPDSSTPQSLGLGPSIG